MPRQTGSADGDRAQPSTDEAQSSADDAQRHVDDVRGSADENTDAPADGSSTRPTDHAVSRRTALKTLGVSGAAALGAQGLATAQEPDDRFGGGPDAVTDEFAVAEIGGQFDHDDYPPEAFTPQAVNGDGVIVGEVDIGEDMPAGFYWHPDDGLVLTNGGLLDVNERGDAVGYGGGHSEHTAVFHPAADPTRSLYLRNYGGETGYHSMACGISDDREIVGVGSTPERLYPVRWSLTDGGTGGSGQGDQGPSDGGSDSGSGTEQDGGEQDSGGEQDGSEQDGGEQDSGGEQGGEAPQDGTDVGDDQSGDGGLLRIDGTDGAAWADYAIRVDGDAEPVTEGDAVANASDGVSANDDGTVTVSGTVGGGADSFRITGEVVGYRPVAGAAITVDGAAVDDALAW